MGCSSVAVVVRLWRGDVDGLGDGAVDADGDGEVSVWIGGVQDDGCAVLLGTLRHEVDDVVPGGVDVGGDDGTDLVVHA